MIYKGRKLEVHMHGRVYHCALDITMDYLGGKWKAVVLWYLIGKPQRFSALKRLMPEVTEKMLSLQLKKLEQDGLVSRKVYPEVPPRVEYALTQDGKTLVPALKAMASWGRHKAQTEGDIIEVPLGEKKAVAKVAGAGKAPGAGKVAGASKASGNGKAASSGKATGTRKGAANS